MPNSDTIYGLRPVRHLTGCDFKANRYFIPATDGTAVFIGDAVKLAGSADTDGVPTVAQAAAGDTIVGVVVGFEVDPDNLTRKHRAASTARYALVVDDPQVIFEIQEDSVGGALAAEDIGNNADIVVGTGNSATGLSGMELDSSTKVTTTAQLRILRVVPRENNAIGANAKIEVLINEHQFKATTGV